MLIRSSKMILAILTLAFSSQLCVADDSSPQHIDSENLPQERPIPSFTPSTAAAERSPHQDPFSLLEFRLNAIGAFQSGGSTYSWQANWNPYYTLNDMMGLRGNVGFSFFKRQITGVFFLTDFAVLFSYQLSKTVFGELGPGVQMWFTTPSVTSFMANLNMRYQLESKLLNYIDSVVIGYAPVFVSNAMTHEIKLGVQVSF